MRKLSFIAALAALFLVACAQGGGEQTTQIGTKYTIHKQGDGVKLNSAEYAYIHLDARVRDSIVFTTREAGEPQIAPILPDSVQSPDVEPILDIIRYLQVGDSITTALPVDSIPEIQRPPFLDGEEFIYYDISVYESVDEETFQARQAAKQAEAMARFEAVRARQPEVLEMLATNQAAYVAGTLENVQTTDSGLKYVIHEEGSGTQAEAGKLVSVQYVGALSSDGTVFDQSFTGGEPIQFPLGTGRVIPGWDEGIALLSEGAKATLIIPSDLGYGASGSGTAIPPNAELMFYVELEEVR
ncbi:MAG: FKBP-type peptidyl-prolyl cis-trans isomerase [Bacteroidota bacterium]